jgi:RNA polymerase sigma-70 factor (ECF subfamily)
MEMTLVRGAAVSQDFRSAEAAALAADEEQLVLQAQAGNEAAYGRLLGTYQSRLYNFVRSMVRNDEIAEDITQESFVKAYFSLGKLQNPGSFKSWLFRIANNNTLDYLRRKRIPVVDTDEALRESYVDERNPEAGVMAEARTAHIRAALDRLKPDQKGILVMCDLQGLSYQEIAEVLNIPFGTVQSRIFYARKKLKELLDTGILFGGGGH